MEKRGAFDYILLETTGLADPGNLAPLFWVDDGLGSTIYLDGIVTLVDAKNILHSLNEEPPQTAEHSDHGGPHLTTAHLQISHADVIVINKADLVSSDELATVRERIQAINGLARIHVTQQGQVPNLDRFLLDLHAYDQVGSLQVAEKGHSHLDPSMSTVTVHVPELTVEQLSKVDEWFRSLLWDSVLPSAEAATAFEIHRLKAKLAISDGTYRVVQGVREMFEIVEAPGQEETWGLARGGKIVLIGRNIADLAFEDSLLGMVRESG